MLRPVTLIAAALFLSACASSGPPPYAAATSQNGAGYSETQIESNRYFVTYRASGSTNAAVLEDYAMLRAAELALQNGRDWFWVDRRTLDQPNSRPSGPSIGVGIGGGSYGGRSGVSGGVGINIPLGSQTATQRARSATLEVRFGEGAKPDQPNAYDARSTANTIRARIAPAG